MNLSIDFRKSKLDLASLPKPGHLLCIIMVPLIHIIHIFTKDILLKLQPRAQLEEQYRDDGVTDNYGI